MYFFAPFPDKTITKTTDVERKGLGQFNFEMLKTPLAYIHTNEKQTKSQTENVESNRNSGSGSGRSCIPLAFCCLRCPFTKQYQTTAACLVSIDLLFIVIKNTQNRKKTENKKLLNMDLCCVLGVNQYFIE